MARPELRVGVVNDLPIATEVLKRTLAGIPECRLAWTAADGAEAVARCREDTPDLVLMDLLMPVMNGVEATRRIMAETPCAILVVTATVSGNLSLVYDAMGFGALDAVNMPVPNRNGKVADDDPLPTKIRMLARLIGKPMATPQTSSLAPAPLIAIGCSTGGPRALADILSRLPAGFPSAIVVVQHVDSAFAQGLCDWLTSLCLMPVSPVRVGAPPSPGVVQLAATNDHLVMRADGTLGYSEDPVAEPFRPSVDVFFESVARYWNGTGVGVILTGMGRDGARGLLALKRAGFRTIAQDEQTSVVFGMPRAAIELGAAAEILPIEGIAPALQAG